MKKHFAPLVCTTILCAAIGLTNCSRGLVDPPPSQQTQTTQAISFSAQSAAPVFCLSTCQVPIASYTVSGITTSDNLVATGPDGTKVSVAITDTGKLPSIPIGGSGVTPGLIQVQIVPPTGTPSASVTLKVISGQKLVAVNHATGQVYLLNPGSNATVKEFQSDGQTQTQSFQTGISDAYSIAVDDTTGYVLVGRGGNPSVNIFDPKQKGAPVSGSFGNAPVVSLGAAAGNAAAALASSSGVVLQEHLGGGTSPVFGPAGTNPTGVAVLNNTVFAYDPSQASLTKLLFPDASQSGAPEPLPFAKVAQGTPPAAYPIAAIAKDDQTTGSGTVGVLGISNNNQPIVVLIDAGNITFHGQASLPAAPYLFVADPSRQGFVAGYWDDVAHVTRFVTISNARGPQAVTATSTTLPVGIDVSADGSKIYLGGGASPIIVPLN